MSKIPTTAELKKTLIAAEEKPVPSVEKRGERVACNDIE